jgi:hypothetical protein
MMGMDMDMHMDEDEGEDAEGQEDMLGMAALRDRC